jgi:hypothetical protein
MSYKMASEWNFYMNPPLVDEYTEEEVNKELIHSAKAFYTCHTPAEVFSNCRKGIIGGLINPESCLEHAKTVFTCYQETKTIPNKCKEIFDRTYECLNKKRICEELIQEYIRCDHPTETKYAGYQ